MTPDMVCDLAAPCRMANHHRALKSQVFEELRQIVSRNSQARDMVFRLANATTVHPSGGANRATRMVVSSPTAFLSF